MFCQPTCEILEEKSGSGNHGREIMEEKSWKKSWKRNHRREIMEGKSCRTMEEKSWKRNHMGDYGRDFGRPSWQEWLREEKAWEINMSL